MTELHLFWAIIVLIAVGYIFWRQISPIRQYKRDHDRDQLTIGYLRKELADVRESYSAGLAAIKQDILDQEVVVTDKPVVLAEEPQIEDSRYVVLPDRIPQHMVDSWRKPITFEKSSKYPSWQEDGTWGSAPGTTVTHVSLWSDKVGGELLSTTHILAKARKEAHDKIVGDYKHD